MAELNCWNCQRRFWLPPSDERVTGNPESVHGPCPYCGAENVVISPLDVLKRLLKEIRRERYAATGLIFRPRPDGSATPEVNYDAWDHIDRIFAPRIERLERLIREADEPMPGTRRCP